MMSLASGAAMAPATASAPAVWASGWEEQPTPHRFRHTFASDMLRAGVSLPALMQLMGHAQIQTTLIYIQVTPLEVYQQYARAVAQHIRPVPGPHS